LPRFLPLRAAIAVDLPRRASGVLDGFAALAVYFSMSFSQNRFPLLRDML